MEILAFTGNYASAASVDQITFERAQIERVGAIVLAAGGRLMIEFG
jgi:hypothetical protein